MRGKLLVIEVATTSIAWILGSLSCTRIYEDPDFDLGNGRWTFSLFQKNVHVPDSIGKLQTMGPPLQGLAILERIVALRAEKLYSRLKACIA